LAIITLGEILGPSPGAAVQWAREARSREKVSLRFCGAAGFSLLLLAFAVLFYAAAAATSQPSLIFAQKPVGAWVLSFLLRQAPAIAALTVLCVQRLHAGRGGSRNLKEGVHPDLLSVFAFLLAADAALLCFVHGVNDDWGLRTTLPISILLAVAIGRFLTCSARKLAKVAVVVLLAVSSLASVNELAQSAFMPRQCPPYGAYAWQDLGGLIGQYEARHDSRLYRWLARQP
jgi:hypothetical protein